MDNWVLQILYEKDSALLSCNARRHDFMIHARCSHESQILATEFEAFHLVEKYAKLNKISASSEVIKWLILEMYLRLCVQLVSCTGHPSIMPHKM